MAGFKAILVDKGEAGTTARLGEIAHEDLPEGEVTVRVERSTLNYKDALAITGKAPVVRKFPMVPGIDFAGTVEESSDPAFRKGQKVLLNGWGVGETHWGGLAQLARVKAGWLIDLPEGLSAGEAMALGTAGYTAMLCVMALEQHGLTPGQGAILVTGACGGVGSVAISLLAGAGYSVTASTGRAAEEEGWLRSLGATTVIDRAELSGPGKPLAKERWAGVIDSVGSHTLANACASTRYGGTVAACGLAQGMDFPATVAPFILRGVTLAGVDSVMAPLARRREAWRRLAFEMDRRKLAGLTTEGGLADALRLAPDLLAGKVRGRLVIDPDA